MKIALVNMDEMRDINMANIQFVTPKTLEELAPHRDNLEFLWGFLDGDLEQILHTWLGHITVIYVDGIVAASFALDVYKTSAELHGVVRSDHRAVAQLSLPIIEYFYFLVYDRVFNTLGKSKIIIKAHSDNKGVRGLVIRHGYQKINNTDKGKWVWKLTKAKYREIQKRWEWAGAKPLKHPAPMMA